MNHLENNFSLLTIKHPEGLVHIEQLKTGKKKISFEPLNQKVYISRNNCETAYPLDLIEQILSVKGPRWLCDEIMRDEDPMYVQQQLKYGILSYVSEDGFKNKRVLDFGCGAGSSTMILARMFPTTELVGVEYEDKLISIARLRAKHYQLDRVNFILSPSSNYIPIDLGDFDYVILSAVYEHLLPNERKALLPRIWQCLKPGGILFIIGTPHRYFPIEFHTTGLPLINYLSDGVVLYLARRFSNRVSPDESWESLQRRGIRGGTDKEIVEILSTTPHYPILLEPKKMGVNDRIELWHKLSSKRLPIFKKTVLFCLKVFRSITGITFTQNLDLAIRKSS